VVQAAHERVYWLVASMTTAIEDLIAELRPRLARAFAAAYGADRGQEALAESLAFAWERRDFVLSLENPAGYLFRVGQSRSRARRTVHLPAGGDSGLPRVEPALLPELERLPERQRVCVVLVYAFEWTHSEVAELLGLSRSSVQNHVERGLARLRRRIGEGDDD
jgi:DNA-directed RNA polymerase specialized sigma24 family protein